IRETEPLAGRLSRKSKAHEFDLARLIVNDEIVSRRLTMKISVDGARNKQSFALTALFQLLINRPYMLGNERLVLFIRLSSLLELPLTFEEGGFVDVGKDVLQRNVVNGSRAEKRWLWNRD